MIVTFAYLLYPLMPPKISKRPLEGIMIYKVVKLLANVDPNYPFTTKQNIFLGSLTAAIVCLLYCIILQHFISSDKAAKFCPNWARVTYSIKREFFGKVDQHYFDQYVK